jgi:hypothetical protein
MSSWYVSHHACLIIFIIQLPFYQVATHSILEGYKYIYNRPEDSALSAKDIPVMDKSISLVHRAMNQNADLSSVHQANAAKPGQKMASEERYRLLLWLLERRYHSHIIEYVQTNYLDEHPTFFVGLNEADAFLLKEGIAEFRNAYSQI